MFIFKFSSSNLIIYLLCEPPPDTISSSIGPKNVSYSLVILYAVNAVIVVIMSSFLLVYFLKIDIQTVYDLVKII